MKLTATQRLLSQTANRLRLAAVGSWTHRTLLGLAALFAVALIGSRLLGVLPLAWFRWETLLVVPGVAILAGLIIARRPDPAVVARVVDERSGSKELFLSATMMQDSAAEFAPVVREQAEQIAPTLRASNLVPFRCGTQVRNGLVALAILAAGTQWLPRLDLLKMEQGRQAATQQEKKLAETKKLTEIRKEELKEKGGMLKEQVEQALSKLDKTLKDMKPELKADNAKKLNEQAQDVSDLWKKATADLPKLMENVERTAQQFGANEQAREMKEMLEKLKKGDASALNKALEEARKKLEEIAKMPDGAERQKKMEQMAKELAKLSNQMKEQLGDKGPNEALKRALEQMGMAKNKEAAQEALQAAADSLNLTKEELEQMAENFKDANNLEDALKNLAKAKQLNQDGKLDGAAAADAKTMADYEKLYKELMGDGEGDGQGQGQGQGQGKAGPNPGRGNGGTPGEDPTAVTKTKDEKSKTKMGAGKLLMQWKEEGVGETGAKAQDYQEAVKAVREGVAEAIRNERIPPGYHGAIQKYFDRLPDKAK